MAEKKPKSVSLAKGRRRKTLTLPSEIVHHKAAGWREVAAPSAAAPQADASNEEKK